MTLKRLKERIEKEIMYEENIADNDTSGFAKHKRHGYIDALKVVIAIIEGRA